MNRPAGEYPYDPRRPPSGYSRAPHYPPQPQYPPQPAYPQPFHRPEPTYLPPLPPPGPPAAQHRPDRRPRRLWYVIATVVLLPSWLSFLVWRGADQPYANEPYTIGTVVDHGSAAEVDGATWRFGSIGPTSVPAGSLTGPPPRDATVVRAYIDVTPHTTAAAKKIANCRFAAQDGEGRVWDVDDDYMGESLSGCLPKSGGDYIPPGRTANISSTFLVPTDAARSLRPMVRPTAQGSYVLFR